MLSTFHEKIAGKTHNKHNYQVTRKTRLQRPLLRKHWINFLQTVTGWLNSLESLIYCLNCVRFWRHLHIHAFFIRCFIFLFVSITKLNINFLPPNICCDPDRYVTSWANSHEYLISHKKGRFWPQLGFIISGAANKSPLVWWPIRVMRKRGLFNLCKYSPVPKKDLSQPKKLTLVKLV